MQTKTHQKQGFSLYRTTTCIEYQQVAKIVHDFVHDFTQKCIIVIHICKCNANAMLMYVPVYLSLYFLQWQLFEKQAAVNNAADILHF